MALFKRWFGTYLCEVERQHGVAENTLTRPRGWVTAPSFDKWPEDQVPAVVVVSIGLAEQPLKDGSGRYRAKWDIVAGAVFSARTQQESRLGSMFYIAALRALLVQRPSLDSGGIGVEWLDEDYTVLEFNDERSLAAGAGRFQLEFDDVVSARAGPLDTDEPQDECAPWSPWSIVQEVDVDVFNVKVDEEIQT